MIVETEASASCIQAALAKFDCDAFDEKRAALAVLRIKAAQLLADYRISLEMAQELDSKEATETFLLSHKEQIKELRDALSDPALLNSSIASSHD